MSRPRLDLSWQLAASPTPDAAIHEWIAASVPGAVQLDWARAHGLPDYTIHDHVREWEALSDHFWTYRSVLNDVPSADETVFLVLEGLDYQADISLDGELLGHHEGGQTPVQWEVTGRLRSGSRIQVVIHPAPKSRPKPDDRSQANQSCKPAVSYGWDFHPRLIPLGLWKDAYLEIRPRTHFQNKPEVHYRLSNLTDAAGYLEVALNREVEGSWKLRWKILDAKGSQAFGIETVLEAGQKTFRIPFNLSGVALWWPHDQGEPVLYSSEVELLSEDFSIADRRSHRIGFRQMRLIMAEGQWEEPRTFPKSRSTAPITLEVNGRSLFVKGTNWVCPDVFPGTLTRERYEEQLQLVRSSNLAMVRMWGGAGAPHDCFYELCDELGILVWQEFPLACNLYPDDEPYLNVLDQESRSMILRLREHPSLAFWCGGNELFNIWSGMTDQSLPIRLLNRNCFDLDPGRPFLATSPLEGMAHGHYVFRDPKNGEECWSVFQRSHCTAYTEFGCPAPASVDLLRKIIPPADLWPPRPGTAWESHHAFGVWMAESHLYQAEIEYYYGPVATLEDLVHHGQLLQAAGYQGMFEEVRRQKPAASMALNWCFNEPWPSAANNSLVSWPCEPKPALAAVAQACRPTLASARIRRFSWDIGDCFDPEIWLLHDGPEALESITISAWIELDHERHHLLDWQTGSIPTNQNKRGPRIQYLLPSFQAEDFRLHLEVPQHPGWNSIYDLRKSRSPVDQSFNPDGTRTMNL